MKFFPKHCPGIGIILAVCLAITPCSYVNAQSPLYEYAFNSGLADSSGNNGPALAATGGTVTGGQWRWTAKADFLSLDISTSPASLKDTYTIEMLIKFDAVIGQGYYRLIDFKNRATDYGFYGYNADLYFYLPPTSSVISNALTANVFSVVRITRNGATKEVRISADGVEKTFTDTNNWANFDSNNKMLFLQDNGSEESTAGTLEYIKIWSTFDAAPPPGVPTQPPTPSPTNLPTPLPTNLPSASPSEVPDPNPSAGGDPHFTTWSGQKYDFHGHCDLVLLHSELFGDDHGHGGGLDIHIRSAPIKTVFSYVSDAAIRVGKDVLEVSGYGKHSINGVSQEVGSTGQVAGYSVSSSASKKGRHVYKVHLQGKTEIIVREYHGWLTVSLFKPTRKDFKGSVGLMGAYGTGEWVGRDGTTIHTEIDEYGKDWRVQPDIDGHLFQEPSPNPDRCNLPTQAQRKKLRRRLQTAKISRGQALEACAHWRPEDVEDCVSDVQISGDLEMAHIID